MARQPTEALWFSHDSGAYSGLKHTALRKRYGFEGYGWYWVLLELMRVTNGNQLPVQSEYDFESLAAILDTDIDRIKSFVHDCIGIRLFQTDKQYIWSDGLKERLGSMLANRDAKSNAGREAARKRWDKEKGKPADPIAEPIAKKAPPADHELGKLWEFWETTQRSGKISDFQKNTTIRMMYQGFGFEKVKAAMEQCGTAAPYLDAVERVLRGEPMLGNGKAQAVVAAAPAKKPDPKDDPVLVAEWEALYREVEGYIERKELMPEEVWVKTLYWTREDRSRKLMLPKGYEAHQRKMMTEKLAKEKLEEEKV